MADDRDTRIKKIQATVKAAQIITNHPQLAAQLGLAVNGVPLSLEGRSEADLTEIERRLGGRVS